MHIVKILKSANKILSRHQINNDVIKTKHVNWKTFLCTAESHSH